VSAGIEPVVEVRRGILDRVRARDTNSVEPFRAGALEQGYLERSEV
jgi:hypothetical protein